AAVVLGGLFIALSNNGHGRVNQLFDLAGCTSTTLSQSANFTGYHGKTSALLTSARGFHSRVERQNIGLKGNTIDNFNNFSHLLGLLVDIPHSLSQAMHGSAACTSDLSGGI